MPSKLILTHADFLVEIQTEELPPKALLALANSFLDGIKTRLQGAFAFTSAELFATPRRLAVRVNDLAAEQADTQVERRGPAVGAAYNADGQPTPACIGFAKSCGITPDQLTRITTPQGEWVGYLQTVKGKTLQAVMPSIVEEALAALPIPKRMRWGNNTIEFVRPVCSVLMLYGKDILPATILGLETGRMTAGHRAHGQKQLAITEPSAYLGILEKSFVIADVGRRKQMIRSQVEALVHAKLGDKAHAIIEEDLLNEVTGLVEWPVAIMGHFEPRFLTVPSECLISAMQDHQRYFPVCDQSGKLLPHFITISNIDSKDMARVIAGNERVIRARLSDAAFFFETDKKRTLESRLDALKQSIFQAKLGTQFDKAVRVSHLAGFIATALKLDNTSAIRAGLLAKTDLNTEMVGEFPELQGIAGYYYALQDGETEAVANALREQYKPRFSGDTIPDSDLGAIVAMADKLDTLMGIFGIQQIPTGDKDPYALRRAALGVLRILIEKKWDLDLDVLLKAASQYDTKIVLPETADLVKQFMIDRLKPWYQEAGIDGDVFAAVKALGVTRPYDFHRRVLAVQAFKQLPEAESLSAANKRVSNILAKLPGMLSTKAIDASLFESDAERDLAQQLTLQERAILPLWEKNDYEGVLIQLAQLRGTIDTFFEHVMVMADNEAVRDNRILLLATLRQLFVKVADIAILATK